MRVQARFGGLALLVLAFGVEGSLAHAAPVVVKKLDVKGDFALMGNTLGQDCAGGVPAPVVGTLGSCGSLPDTFGDTSIDVFWGADTNGGASADAGISVANAASTAVLQLPAGATVAYARLYWAAVSSTGAADTDVTVQRPGAGGFDVRTVTAAAADVHILDHEANRWYQGSADVTDLVKQFGSGAYRVGGVDSKVIVDVNNSDPFAAWAMVVFYEDGGKTTRNLTLFDVFDLVAANSSVGPTEINGFLVPQSGYDAKLGVIAFEGDNSITGDALLFNNANLSNALNPQDNFFNGTRSFFDNPVSVTGDLPQLTGGPGSMSGVDLDVIDITSQLSPGATSATFSATSSGDGYALGAFVTSVSTFTPDFSGSSKTVSDVNGGALQVGDTLRYKITVSNTGNDTSKNTVLNDPLPAGLTYVPGTITVQTGDGTAKTLTDAGSDDEGEYLAASRTVRVRLGDGAGSGDNQGGALAVGGAAVIVAFDATLDVAQSIENKALINAAGDKGAPASDFPTDGDSTQPGAQPTVVTPDACADDGQCTSAATPVCDTGANPNACVECLDDGKCHPERPKCNLATKACQATLDDPDNDGLPTDVETTLGTDPNNADSDGDGVPDGKEPAFDQDTDKDGLINALDTDSDNDGLADGTELGLGCTAAAKHCVPDADQGATKTDPLLADTDGGGVSDGSEDSNLNGAVDAGETNPTAGNAADDKVADQDKDGLGDALEATLRSNPTDADSDDDGVPDGLEANPADDTDGDGARNVIDADSDNDGLFDGTETGKGCDNGGATDPSKKQCIADADNGATVTSPVNADTDRGGARDGSEDVNRNGAIDAGETDPTVGHGADDNQPQNADTDGDGLSDKLETSLGSDPNSIDSDKDGVPDGREPNPAADTDGDGRINLLDFDSDNDGVFDGTELGLDCTTAPNSPDTCRPDADQGATVTSPLLADTDGGGVNDGDEDTNKNGKVDVGERNPLDPADDKGGTGAGGNGGAAANANDPLAGRVLEGGGCSVRPTAPPDAWGIAAALGVIFATARRRRQG